MSKSVILIHVNRYNWNGSFLDLSGSEEQVNVIQGRKAT